MGIEQEGSIAFRLRHADADWATNDKPYRFNTVEAGPVRAWAMKRANRTVEFHVSGPLKSEIVLRLLVLAPSRELFCRSYSTSLGSRDEPP